MTIFTHHIQFWLGLFSGGTLGYLYGSMVQASVKRELEDAEAWIAAVRAGKLKI